MKNTFQEAAQSRAARIAGAMYLIAMAAAIFAVVIVRSPLIVSGDAAQTAKNIIESEGLFRISIVGDLTSFIGVIVLTWALYVLLRPVNKNLALFAVFLRLTETAIHIVMTLGSLVVLKLLSGSDYLKTFEADQLHSLARLAMIVQGSGINIGFILLGMGSAVFAYLLLRSGYIPKVIAAWGIFASSLLAAAALLNIVFPGAAGLYQSVAFGCMGIFEISLGFWLLIKGVMFQSNSAGKKSS